MWVEASQTGSDSDCGSIASRRRVPWISDNQIDDVLQLGSVKDAYGSIRGSKISVALALEHGAVDTRYPSKYSLEHDKGKRSIESFADAKEFFSDDDPSSNLIHP